MDKELKQILLAAFFFCAGFIVMMFTSRLLFILLDWIELQVLG